MEPRRQRCGRGRRGELGPPGPARRGARPAARPHGVLADRRRRARGARGGRPRRRRDRAGRAPRHGHHRQPRHDHLHERDDRAAQGLRADPRQPARRRALGRRGPAAAVLPRGLDAAVPPARPRVRPLRAGGLRRDPREDGPQQRHQEPARRLRHLPADLHPVGPAGVREGLQLGEAEGARRRQGPHLRRRREGRDRLQRGARRGRRRRPAAGPARPVRQARLRQAARRHGRPGRVRVLRRRPARRPPRALLPRHRRHHLRGLRAHRDQRPQHHEHARATCGSAPSGGPAPA